MTLVMRQDKGATTFNDVQLDHFRISQGQGHDEKRKEYVTYTQHILNRVYQAVIFSSPTKSFDLTVLES